MRVLNTCMCLGGLVLLMCLLLAFGCEPREIRFPESDAGSTERNFPESLHEIRPWAGDYHAMPGWQPRTHPPGTLLRDSGGDLWMAANWLERVPVSGDALAEAGIREDLAVSMTAAEERCLLAVEPYWWGRALSDDWWPLVGPDREEWLVHAGFGLKRHADFETLRSFGFGVMIDEFDGQAEEWDRLREAEPLGFRDGYLLRTERGISYFVRGERWLFASDVLAEEAGYDLSRVRTVSEDRVPEHPVIGTFTRETFTICPAETPLADMNDRDHDGVPVHRDCDDAEALVGEGFTEVCDGFDNDCNGVTDDADCN